jgi:hypothetical protein
LQNVHVAGRPGHYGIHLGDVFAGLVRDFSIAAGFEHSLSFNTGARACVMTRGSIRDGSLDQHRGVNHQNLYDAIDVLESDAESRLLTHGGARYWGPPHGAFNTFWNVQITFATHPDAPVFLGQVRGAGPARVVGLRANSPIRFEYENAYVEGLQRADLSVLSLYEYQLSRRLR